VSRNVSPKASDKKLKEKKVLKTIKKLDSPEIKETLEFPKFSLIMKSKFENKTFDNIEEATKTKDSRSFSPRSSINFGNATVTTSMVNPQ